MSGRGPSRNKGIIGKMLHSRHFDIYRFEKIILYSQLHVLKKPYFVIPIYFMVSLKKITKYAYFCLPLEWPNPLTLYTRESL